MKKMLGKIAVQAFQLTLSGALLLGAQSGFAQVATTSAGNSEGSLNSTPAADAQLATAVTTAETSVPAQKISGLFQLGRSNSLYIVNGESAAASWDYSMAVGYKFSKLWSMSATVEGSQDIKVPEDSDVGKAVLKTTYNGISAAEDRVQWIPSLSAGFPVSRAQNSATFQGSLSTTMKAVFNPDYFFSKKLSLYLAVAGARSFHKFETSASGSVNTKTSSTQTLSVGWNFTDAFSLSVDANHYHTWSYQGALTESYNHIEELGYELSSHWALALGHQYGNPTVSIWKADRATANYNPTDEANSMAYGTVTYTF